MKSIEYLTLLDNLHCPTLIMQTSKFTETKDYETDYGNNKNVLINYTLKPWLIKKV